MVKNPPAIWETWVQSVGWEDPLKEDMATHSSILAWRISMDRGVWCATVHGVTKSQTRQKLSIAHIMYKHRKQHRSSWASKTAGNEEVPGNFF